MKAKIFAAALLVTVFFVGFGNQASARPWHRGYGYFHPHVAIRVGVPAPVIIAGAYGAPYAPGYCAPAPAPVVVDGYYGARYYRRPYVREGYYGRGAYGYHERYERGYEHRGYAPRGTYGPRGYGRR